MPVETEDCAGVLLRTDRGTLANVTVSQVTAGRKNRLWFELDGARGSAAFDQEHAEQIWLGTEEGARIVVRDPLFGADEQRRLSQLPAGHAQGYTHCFDNFVADTYAAIAGACPDGLPTFQDGLRAAQIVHAVLESSAKGQWTEISGVPVSPRTRVES